ncbi:uncharacterized protein [Nicotiana tomentosiformis]|uniref:uncharacterized protein isoform X1 n=1 Tax=Nicotiana tomentosiformis TaxID=4098 RepID=UPI00051C2A07|nr:uncharacterized protein LOC104118595 isoform X2 [Nicotiana tomentosiformis]
MVSNSPKILGFFSRLSSTTTSYSHLALTNLNKIQKVKSLVLVIHKAHLCLFLNLCNCLRTSFLVRFLLNLKGKMTDLLLVFSFLEQIIIMNIAARLQRLNPDLRLDHDMLRFSARSPVEASSAHQAAIQLNNRPSAGSNNQDQWSRSRNG